jgi:tetratricopeptide (TPR) repeat protein
VVAAGTSGAPPAGVDIPALVADLGADDHGVREAATERLASLGAAAADALFEAAANDADTESSLRARSLLESMPLDSPHDPPAVAALVRRFAGGERPMQALALHGLLRLDDGAGIEALARIARLDHTAAGSLLAAALLAGEWRPGDESWEVMREPILAGVGGSRRPAARFLRALAAFGARGEPAAAADPCREALAALDAVDVPANADAAAARRVLRRCATAMLATAGRRDEALAEVGGVLESDDRDDPDPRAAANLVWLAENGLPEAVDVFRARWPALVANNPVVAYAVAIALQARGSGGDEAAAMADAAFALRRGTDEELGERLRLAIMLTRWGAADWAAREYETVLGGAAADPGEFALAGIMYSEALHDEERDEAAAAVLGRLLAGRADATGEQVLERLDRDLETVRARMRYFESCAAAARGDAAGTRRLLEDSLRHHPQDVDALIALFRLPDNTPAQAAEARALVTAAATRLDDRVEAQPDVADGYNEYAWLVANTLGDVARADRYARVALDRHARTAIEIRDETPLDGGLDSPSYLDTLAHCRAADGDVRGAVRIQSVARRLEPHGRTIGRNLARFRGLEAAP